MVPPCFAAPLQARPCALASASICAVTGAPGAGLAHSASPAQLRGHLPPRACLPGSIVRAFCQARSGRTLLIQAVCFLPKGTLAPCSYYNTQKRWICQPGNGLVLTVLAAHGQARPLYNLSVGLTPASSPGRGAFGKEVSSQRNGELAGLSAPPEPPLLGEVALRSNDGEVVQSRALSGRAGTPSASSPSQSRSARQLPQRGSRLRLTASRC